MFGKRLYLQALFLTGALCAAVAIGRPQSPVASPGNGRIAPAKDFPVVGGVWRISDIPR